ncbi:MAG: sensor histidine kinase [Chloroflexota bacterium]|nr:sensor histidine kinase [Chloroflexota bacterium]
MANDYYCETPENIREVRPFYLVIALVLTLIFAWSLYTLPELREPLRFLAFTVLMLAHGVLHWIGPNLTTRRHWLIPFFAAQGALALTITLIVPTQSVLIGLYLCLIGESVGVLEKAPHATIAVAGYTALSAINFGLLWGWERLPQWFLGFAPSAFVVVVIVAMFVRQARARARAQALLHELETAHWQVREYAARVEELTLTNERQRIARELHDTLAQGLAGVILQLEAIDSSLARGKMERAQSIVNQAMARARATLLDARHAIGDLRATESVSSQMAEAVREETNRFTSASGIPCALDLAVSSPLRALVREHAFRAVAEGLANVARHARASRVWIRVAQCDGQLEINVRDDGCGFDLESVHSHAGHFGLLGLRERARLAGGSMEITSAVGQGTTLALRLPIQNQGAR